MSCAFQPVTTGTPIRSTNFRNGACCPDIRTPAPASTTGRSAAFWEECYGGPEIVPLTLASGPYLRERGMLSPRGALYIARDGDEAALARCAALIRLSEMFERSRDQSVHAAHVEVEDGRVEIRLEADADVSVARWAAERQSELFERAFGKELALTG